MHGIVPVSDLRSDALSLADPPANDPPDHVPERSPGPDAARLRAYVHDLRNPAGAIGMAANLLGSTVGPLIDALPAAQRALARTALAALSESVDQMRHILDHLSAQLPAPLVEHGPSGPVVEAFARPSSVALDEVLRRLEILVVTRSATPGLVHVACPPGLSVLGRPSEILRAMVNVVENALEAASSGGRKQPRVEVTARAVRGGVEVTVANAGPKMPEAVAAYLEGRSETPPISTHGNGIGVTVVRRVMEGHGGSVRVVRRHGVTYVTLRFPAAGATPE